MPSVSHLNYLAGVGTGHLVDDFLHEGATGDAAQVPVVICNESIVSVDGWMDGWMNGGGMMVRLVPCQRIASREQ